MSAAWRPLRCCSTGFPLSSGCGKLDRRALLRWLRRALLRSCWLVVLAAPSPATSFLVVTAAFASSPTASAATPTTTSTASRASPTPAPAAAVRRSLA